MSLEKVASGLGSIIKIIVYGFIILVIIGMFFAYKMVGDSKEAKSNKPAEIAKVSQDVVKPNKEVVESKKGDTATESTAKAETEKPVVESVVKEPEADTIESKIGIEILDIKPGNPNSVAKAYNSIDLKVRITNDSDKVVQGIKGSLILKDAFGDDVMAFSIKEDGTIKPHTSKIDNLSYEISMFSNKEQNATQLKKWSSQFKPIKILVD